MYKKLCILLLVAACTHAAYGLVGNVLDTAGAAVDGALSTGEAAVDTALGVASAPFEPAYAEQPTSAIEATDYEAPAAYEETTPNIEAETAYIPEMEEPTQETAPAGITPESPLIPDQASVPPSSTQQLLEHGFTAPESATAQEDDLY